MRNLDAIAAAFPDNIDRRFRIVFAELLGFAEKQVKQQPDRDLIDMISRARLIAATFKNAGK